ncbi:MAG: GntR family transcriptional regulator [Phototrophicaceae bacterium]
MHLSTPKYIQLIEIIKDAIQQGELVPEQQLPNEDEIAAQYGMSRGTVRKAIAELQRMGLLRKEQGRGTFINEPKPTLNSFSLVEFDQYAQTHNRVPSTETLVFETLAADATVAQKLEIPMDTEVIHIVQLRLASGMPLVYEERTFAKAWCPDLSAELLEKHSLHWLLIEQYKIPLVRLSHTIEMSTLPNEQFALFKVKQAVPIFSVDRLSFTRHDAVVLPAVWYQALYRADEYYFQAQFHTSI